MYQIQEFKDRDAMNPNKRRITILEQNANEIIANIEPVAEEITEEGTPLNADLMKKFQNSIVQSETDSAEALRIAKDVRDAVQDGQGTTVFVNGEYAPTFNANLKADKTTTDNIEQRLSTIEAKPVNTKITYDVSTDTFIF